MSQQPHTLEYGTQGRQKRRWVVRSILYLVFAGVLALYFGTDALRIRAFRRQLEEMWRMHSMMVRDRPADQVVWDNTSRKPVIMPGAGFGSADQESVVLFSHGRTKSTGRTNLVVVTLVQPRSGQGEHLAVTLFELPTLTSWTRHHGPDTAYDAPPIVGGPPKKMYAGQFDRSDSSHFTIDYEIGGQRKTLDGWLIDSNLSTSGGRTALKMSSREGTSTVAAP